MNASTADNGNPIAGSPLPQAAIDVRGLEVELRRERHPVRSLRAFAIARLARRRIVSDRLCVLRGVSFQVQRGDLFALLGPNGAGKTTMLRVLAGIVPPHAGRVSVCGRVAPMIELGVGLEGDLDGRENVFLYGTLIGMGLGQIEAAYEDIVAFAGLADVMDVPLRQYSTGMLARLGFAIVTASSPDVLLVDEVLAVGDEEFRRSCMRRIEDLRHLGTTVVLVSHDLDTVAAVASRALYLEGGETVAVGPAAEVVECYRRRSA